MTNDMETLQNAIFLDMVPESWTRRAYPSMSGLGSWFTDLLNRIRELETWIGDFMLPSVVWLAGFFNPQSFLTAIMQSMARKNEWPLDKMTLQCDVTKRNREEFTSPPREGAYIHGLFMEGARWDMQETQKSVAKGTAGAVRSEAKKLLGSYPISEAFQSISYFYSLALSISEYQTGLIADARLKDLTPPMPIIFIKAILVDKQDTRNVYPCPVYKTRQRGPTYIWTFNLKTKEKPSKWILAGVALLLQI
ncbi:hypothetical protein Chor_012011 [Crotalus horridus]